jgi:phage replication O-like protein O
MAVLEFEDGYTMVANEILEQLAKSHIRPDDWRVLIFIIRKTYGYRKEADYISNSQMAAGTSLHKSTISHSLRRLQETGLISRNSRLIGFQRDYTQWQLKELPTKEQLEESPTELKGLPTGLKELPTKVAGSSNQQKKEENIQNKTSKRKHGEFQNVLLSDEEYQKLKDRFGAGAEPLIENLSSYLASKGKRYKSHYATILNWQCWEKEGKGGTTGNRRTLPQTYTDSPDYADL